MIFELEFLIAEQKISQRQRYWRDHLKAATTGNDTLVGKPSQPAKGATAIRIERFEIFSLS